jgi:hypothetical protein
MKINTSACAQRLRNSSARSIPIYSVRNTNIVFQVSGLFLAVSRTWTFRGPGLGGPTP